MHGETRDRVVLGGRSVDGEIVLPGDKSVSHRALMLAAVAEGVSTVRNLSPGEDVASTLRSLRTLGVDIRDDGGVLRVTGAELSEPGEPLDLGNAGTGMRLICGLLSGYPMMSVLTGDASLRSRPMGRIITPLSAMGARIESRTGGLAPLVCLPSELTGMSYELPVPSAQVKGAILLAGLRATGSTTVIEAVTTRTYTEDMLATFGARVQVEGNRTTVWPSALAAASVDVPGDPSQSAFWVVAACMLPGGSITIADVETSAPRIGYLHVLRRMGASVELVDGGIRAHHTGRLLATDIDPSEVPSLVDEVPVLAVAAASAKGTSVFRGLGELVHKETNRLEAVHAMLTAFGVRSEISGEDLVIEGSPTFTPAVVESRGDHRMVMSAAVAALRADGESLIRDVACVDTSYPNFFETLESVATG